MLYKTYQLRNCEHTWTWSLARWTKLIPLRPVWVIGGIKKGIQLKLLSCCIKIPPYIWAHPSPKRWEFTVFKSNKLLSLISTPYKLLIFYLMKLSMLSWHCWFCVDSKLQLLLLVLFYCQLRVIEIRQSQVLNIFDNQAKLSRINSDSEIIV